MGKTSAAIHTNRSLSHQVEFAEYLKAGLTRHGVKAWITSQIDAGADLHLVLGPHYAKSQWLGHTRTILLDRCFWGDAAKVVTLAWMTADGGRVIPEKCPADRDKPELLPWVYGDKVIELVDYGKQPVTGHDYRLHPAVERPEKTLAELFQDYHIAVGGVGTALIDAAIHGLPVVCLDSRSVCVPIASESTENPKRPEREQWLNNLSYMNWRGDEIASGQAFEYLL